MVFSHDHPVLTSDELLIELSDLEFNLLLHKPAGLEKESGPAHGRIDIWWAQDQGNLAFALALLRFLLRAPQWEQAKLRFLLVTTGTSQADLLKSSVKRLLREARLEAEIQVLPEDGTPHSLLEKARNHSSDAGLVLLGIPENRPSAAHIDLTRRSIRDLPETIVFHASPDFSEQSTGTHSDSERSLAAELEAEELSDAATLTLPDLPDLAVATRSFHERYQRQLALTLENGLTPLYAKELDLLDSLAGSVKRHLSPERVRQAGNPRKRRKAFNRQQGALTFAAQELFESYRDEGLRRIADIYSASLERYLEAEKDLDAKENRLLVAWRRADLAPDRSDNRHIRRAKSRLRRKAWFLRRIPLVRLPLRRLERFYFQRSFENFVQPAFKSYLDKHLIFIKELGQLMQSSRWDFDDHGDHEKLELSLVAERDALLLSIDEKKAERKGEASRANQSLLAAGFRLSQDFGQDLQRFDFRRLIRKSRKVTKLSDSLNFTSQAKAWEKQAKALAERAVLSMSLLRAQYRLRAALQRAQQTIHLHLRTGPLQSSLSLLEKLNHSLNAITESEAPPEDAFDVIPYPDLDLSLVLDDLRSECIGCTDELPEEVLTLSDEAVFTVTDLADNPQNYVEVPVRRQVQYLIEAELLDSLGGELQRVFPLDTQCKGLLQDISSLLTFQFAEATSQASRTGEAVLDSVSPVLVNCRERLEEGIAQLKKLQRSLDEAFSQKLLLVAEGTNAYELSEANRRLEQHIRLEQGRKAVSGLRGMFGSLGQKLYEQLVKLVYGQSAGILLSQKWKRSGLAPESQIERIVELAQREQAPLNVLEEVPSYYRQLFFGQSGVSESFWVGRQKELEQARRAVQLFDHGTPGVLYVLGERMGGKTSFLQKIASEFFSRRKVFRVHPRSGGSIREKDLLRSFHQALPPEVDLALDADLNQIFGAFPDGSMVQVDDLHLWWERAPGGDELLKLFYRCLKKHEQRLFIVIAVDTQAFRIINRFVDIGSHALGLIECGPLPAAELREIVMLRHNSTGLRFELKKKGSGDLGGLALARLFSRHFSHSRGNVGSTLRNWVNNIR
ncbi:MAG: ATP-binding protein, partial [Polyangiaceae bacterium]|nr:ATP-binding protein [Polyangiaceae bacterium]